MNDYKKEIYFEGLKSSLDEVYIKELTKINENSKYSEEQRNASIRCLQEEYNTVKLIIETSKNKDDMSNQLNHNPLYGNRFITKQELQELFARNTRC